VKLSKRKKSTKKKKAATCRTVKNPKTGKKRKVCRPAPAKAKARKVATPKPAPVPKPLPRLPVPSSAAPPVVVALPEPEPARPSAPAPPAAATTAPRPALPAPPTGVQPALSRRDAERLLWRAGFGPRRGEADRLAGRDPREIVQGLTRPGGAATLTGAEPHDENGNSIDPYNAWGHGHLWWMDRMVRSDQPLVERMTLIWHDWFATTNEDVNNEKLMMDQNELFRSLALGSFQDLALAVTANPAMLAFLSGIDNHKRRPNENYARELMELFTLGADRGAYTEADVRELARALTGWRADWSDDIGLHNFRFDASRHDTATKTLWAGQPHQRTGNFDWQDAVRLCLEHPMHRSFFVRKLWGSFIPTPPDAETQAALEGLYWNSGFQIRPVVEAILLHPDLYAGAPLVKPPAVYAAGLLRARNRTITTSWWSWLGDQAGQLLFYPPSVAGWNDQAWLDTATLRGRWVVVYTALRPEAIDPWDETTPYSRTETPEQAVADALAFWDHPTLTPETVAELHTMAASLPPNLAGWEQGPLRAERQNALRHLIATSPDFHTC
jgi:hypothetical protein